MRARQAGQGGGPLLAWGVTNGTSAQIPPTNGPEVQWEVGAIQQVQERYEAVAAPRPAAADKLAAAALVAATAALYGPVLAGMVTDWWRNDSASHGFLVPVIAGWLAWRKRHRAAAAARPAAWGAAVVAGGLLLYGVGLVAAVEFLPQLSLLVTLAGIVLCLWGPGTLREMAFPYAFLLFMVPWPDTLVEFISFPMQLFSAKSATMAIGLMGAPVSRDGVDIHLARYTFAVAAPCSGMKSLVALLALAALVAYLLDGPRWKRWALFAAGAPLAVLANVVRIVVILGIALVWGAKAAEGFFHGVSGLVVFVVATLALAGVGRALGLRPGGRGRPEPGTRARPVRWRHLLPPLVLVLAAQGAVLAGRGGSEENVLRPDFARVPMRMAGWQGEDLGPLDKMSEEMLRPDAYLARSYVRDDGYPVQVVAVFGHEKQTFHSPGFCLLGGGWNITGKARRAVKVGGRESVEANEFSLQRAAAGPEQAGVQRRAVLYWYASYRETTPSWVLFQYRLLRNRLTGRPDRGALLRFAAPVAPGGTNAEARAAIDGLVVEVAPQLTEAMGL
jgi:EpsI family protein